MAGALSLTTPWAQRYLSDPDARARVRELVPDGCTLRVSARVRPGDWTIALIDPSSSSSSPAWTMRVRMLDLEGACIHALHAHDRQRVVITTDAEGYIESIEDAP